MSKVENVYMGRMGITATVNVHKLFHYTDLCDNLLLLDTAIPRKN